MAMSSSSPESIAELSNTIDVQDLIIDPYSDVDVDVDSDEESDYDHIHAGYDIHNPDIVRNVTSYTRFSNLHRSLTM